LYVTGEATAEVDVPSALHAYRAAAEEALKVDNRLFLGLARSSAVALASRCGSPLEVLAEFEQVMGAWDELGNVAAQWWMLLQVALLLGRIGRDRPAALLIGAFRENGKQTYMLLGDQDRFQNAVATVADRLGAETASATLAEGAELSFDDAAALARETLAAVRSESTRSHRPDRASLDATSQAVDARQVHRL
jgi:hypothetical protein